MLTGQRSAPLPYLHLGITIAGLALPIAQTHVPWHTAYAFQPGWLCSVFLPTSVPPEHYFKPKPQWPPSVLAIYRQVTTLGRGQLFCISMNSLHSRDRTDSCAAALSSLLATWTKVPSTILTVPSSTRSEPLSQGSPKLSSS